MDVRAIGQDEILQNYIDELGESFYEKLGSSKNLLDLRIALESKNSIAEGTSFSSPRFMVEDVVKRKNAEAEKTD